MGAVSAEWCLVTMAINQKAGGIGVKFRFKSITR